MLHKFVSITLFILCYGLLLGQDGPEFQPCDHANVEGSIVPIGNSPCIDGAAVGNSIKQVPFRPNLYKCHNVVAGYRPFGCWSELPAFTIRDDKTIIYFTHPDIVSGEFQHVELCHEWVSNGSGGGLYDHTGYYLAGYVDKTTAWQAIMRIGFLMKTDIDGNVVWTKVFEGASDIVNVVEIKHRGYSDELNVVAVGSGSNGHAVVASFQPNGTANYVNYYAQSMPTGSGGTIPGMSYASAVECHNVTNSSGISYSEAVVLVNTVDEVNGNTSHLMTLNATTGIKDMTRPNPWKRLIPNSTCQDLKIDWVDGVSSTPGNHKDKFYVLGRESNFSGGCSMVYAEIDETIGSPVYNLRKYFNASFPDLCITGKALEQFNSKVFIAANMDNGINRTDMVFVSTTLPVSTTLSGVLLDNSEGLGRSNEEVRSIDRAISILNQYELVATGFSTLTGVKQPFIINKHNPSTGVLFTPIFCEASVTLNANQFSEGGSPSYIGTAMSHANFETQSVYFNVEISPSQCTFDWFEGESQLEESRPEGDKIQIAQVSKMNKLEKLHFKLMPNPASSSISVSGLDREKNYQINIINSEGKVVIKHTKINGYSTEIDIEKLSTGNYSVELISKGRTVWVKKFVKD